MQKQKTNIKNVLRYIFGVLFLMTALSHFGKSPLASIIFIAMSAMLLPPVLAFISQKIGANFTRPIKIGTFILLFVLAGASLNQSDEKKEQKAAEQKIIEQETKKQQIINLFESNKDSIIMEIKTAIDGNVLQKAVTLSQEYLITGNEELVKLNEIAKEKFKVQRISEILLELKKVPSSEYDKNLNLYKQLSLLDPGNEKYKLKIAEYSKKIELENEKKLAAENRMKLIEEQFSAWDGSHYGLTRLIKEEMNDPKSYKHVKTVYWDRGDHLVVQTTFRGTNAFGGVVKNTVKAKVSLNGQVLQIIDQF
ncbi:MAG: hypothetical protein GX638_13705 [Crenarchaeota archaeon]|nr:hypothetical protein [Thermoproteota archaeon]